MRRSLASYLGPGDVFFYQQVGNVGVYWPTHRAAARARLARHMDEHGCGQPGFAIMDCPVAAELWYAQDPSDQVAFA